MKMNKTLALVVLIIFYSCSSIPTKENYDIDTINIVHHKEVIEKISSFAGEGIAKIISVKEEPYGYVNHITIIYLTDQKKVRIKRIRIPFNR